MYGTDLPSITFMHITTATYVALVTYQYLPKTKVMLCKFKRQNGNYGIAMCIVKHFRGDYRPPISKLPSTKYAGNLKLNVPHIAIT